MAFAAYNCPATRLLAALALARWPPSGFVFPVDDCGCVCFALLLEEGLENCELVFYF